MFYCTRKQGAQGIATEIIEVESVDVLHAMRPDVEPLAAFFTLADARRYMVSETHINRHTNAYKGEFKRSK